MAKRTKESDTGPPKPWRVVEQARNVHIVEMAGGAIDGWEQWFLLSSDRHHDSPKADHDLERRHLDEARARKACVLDFGDVFDAMQGRDDRRRGKAGLRPEHARSEAYIDDLVRTHAEFYAPWADLFGLVTPGNHERSVQEKIETDLTERFATTLSILGGSKVHRGGYGGWVMLRLDAQGAVAVLKMHYFHGSGGGGMMTFDALRVRRNGSYMPDADIVVGGHVHEAWHIPLARERLRTVNGAYCAHRDIQHHVRCGTYKDAHGDGFGGWDVERGLPPKPKGAVWMRLTAARERNKDAPRVFRIVPEFTLAVE